MTKEAHPRWLYSTANSRQCLIKKAKGCIFDDSGFCSENHQLTRNLSQYLTTDMFVRHVAVSYSVQWLLYICLL